MPSRPPILEPGAGLGHIRALDGLRAVAVIAVMMRHHLSGQGIGGWSGGFLGVDVFFVLSGFLITSLLLIDHDRTGRVISWGFWRRRARRLIPALLVFLVVVAVQTRLFVPSYLYDEVRRSALATLAYVQNYWQLYGGDTGRTPLEHTWSLSIEEQFYLLWPLALAGLLALTRNRPRLLAGGLAAAALASSAAMALLFTPGDPWRVYLGLDTRAHQLLVGALVAVVVRILPPARGVGLRALEIAALGALAAIGVAFFTARFMAPWLYRGGMLAIALAVGVVLVAVLHPPARVLHAVLGFRPLAAIGLISYGLYLFHIPVFNAVEPGRFELQGFTLMAVRFGITGALAVASYRLVEQPIRRQASWLPPMRALAPGAIAVTVLVLALATSGAAPTPPDAPERLAFYEYARKAHGRTRVLVVGDTIAWDLGTRVAAPFTDARIIGATIGRPGCALVSGTIVVAGRRSPGVACGEPLGVRIERAVRHFSPHVVAMSVGPFDAFDRERDGRLVRFGSDAHARAIRRQLDGVRRAATERGAHMMLLTSPCTRAPTDGPGAALARLTNDPTRRAWLNQQLRAYARDHGVMLADLDRLLCRNGLRRSNPVWTDDGIGLNAAGADAVWRWLGEQAGALHPVHVGIPRRPDDLT